MLFKLCLEENYIIKHALDFSDDRIAQLRLIVRLFCLAHNFKILHYLFNLMLGPQGPNFEHAKTVQLLSNLQLECLDLQQ